MLCNELICVLGSAAAVAPPEAPPPRRSHGPLVVTLLVYLGRRVERDDLGHGRAVATKLGVDEGREAVAVRNLRVHIDP